MLGGWGGCGETDDGGDAEIRKQGGQRETEHSVER